MAWQLAQAPSRHPPQTAQDSKFVASSILRRLRRKSADASMALASPAAHDLREPAQRRAAPARRAGAAPAAHVATIRLQESVAAAWDAGDWRSHHEAQRGLRFGRSRGDLAPKPTVSGRSTSALSLSFEHVAPMVGKGVALGAPIAQRVCDRPPNPTSREMIDDDWKLASMEMIERAVEAPHRMCRNMLSRCAGEGIVQRFCWLARILRGSERRQCLAPRLTVSCAPGPRRDFAELRPHAEPREQRALRDRRRRLSASVGGDGRALPRRSGVCRHKPRRSDPQDF